jgi:hypothetical protein
MVARELRAADEIVVMTTAKNERPLKLVLVPSEGRTDLVCLWCGRFGTEFAVDNCLDGGPFVGLHRQCFRALQDDAREEKLARKQLAAK